MKRIILVFVLNVVAAVVWFLLGYAVGIKNLPVVFPELIAPPYGTPETPDSIKRA